MSAFFKPGSYGLITFTLILGFLLNLFPWGNSAWVPDFLVVVLAFWVLQAPKRLDLTPGFFLGILMDIQTSQFLGIHSISYVVTCFLIIFWERRLLNSTLLGQTFVIFQIFLFASSIQMTLLWLMGTYKELSLMYLLIPCILQACMWPILKKILSAGHPTSLNRNHN
jgi:rod shape-determining protein MreD